MILLFEIAGVTFRLIDAVDIVVVTLLLFFLYRALRGTIALNIGVAILLIYAISILLSSQFLNMRLLSSIFKSFFDLGLIALVIVFQPEIRRFLIMLGKTFRKQPRQWFKKINILSDDFEEEHEDIVLEISNVLHRFSETKTGALLVFTQQADLTDIVESGVYIGGDVTQKLLESIFHKESPLHDGAVIISQRKIEAANCVLPLSDNPKLPSHIGTRHRAAVGISEKSDAIVFIVSEESGAISYARNGEIKYDINYENVNGILKRMFTFNRTA